MRYVVTQDFNYHGLEMFVGEELDDRVDYIASNDGIEPDMFGEWLHRGWISVEGQAASETVEAVDFEADTQDEKPSKRK